MTKILFLSTGPIQAPAPRYRIYQFIKYIEKDGCNCKVISARSEKIYLKYAPNKCLLYKIIYFLSAIISRLIVIPKIKKYDIIFIQRLVWPLMYPLAELLIIKYAHKLNKKVIFDFDDAIFVRPSERKKSIFSYFRDKKSVERVIKNSDKIIVGNKYLKDYAINFNKNTTIIPTSIDLNRYLLPKKINNQKSETIIGWIGSPSSFLPMKILEKVFQTIAKRYNIVIKIIGIENYKIPYVETICKKWSLETEIEELYSFDIGVMPLLNDVYAKGKCGCKLLQYMAAGIPSVASPVGVNKEIIKDGYNGFLANTEDEWINKIEQLILNSELRKKFAKNGRETIEKYYSVHVNIKKLIEIFLHIQK